MLAGQVVRIGEVVEASPSDARLLIGIGKAIVTAKVAVEFRLQPDQNHNPLDGGLSHDHSQPWDQN
jgi:hypothetical protein